MPLAVIDTADREPVHGEPYVIKYDSPARPRTRRGEDEALAGHPRQGTQDTQRATSSTGSARYSPVLSAFGMVQFRVSVRTAAGVASAPIARLLSNIEKS